MRDAKDRLSSFAARSPAAFTEGRMRIMMLADLVSSLTDGCISAA